MVGVLSCSQTDLELRQMEGIRAKEAVNSLVQAAEENNIGLFRSTLSRLEAKNTAGSRDPNFDWLYFWNQLELESHQRLLDFFSEIGTKQNEISRLLSLHGESCREDHFFAFHSFIRSLFDLNPLEHEKTLKIYVQNRSRNFQPKTSTATSRILDEEKNTSKPSEATYCPNQRIPVESIHLVLGQLLTEGLDNQKVNPYEIYFLARMLQTDALLDKDNTNEVYLAKAYKVLSFFIEEIDRWEFDRISTEFFSKPSQIRDKISAGNSRLTYLLPTPDSQRRIETFCKLENQTLCLWFGLTEMAVTYLLTEMDPKAKNEPPSYKTIRELLNQAEFDKLAHFSERILPNVSSSQVLADFAIQYSQNPPVRQGKVQYQRSEIIAQFLYQMKGRTSLLRQIYERASRGFSDQAGRQLTAAELISLIRIATQTLLSQINFSSNQETLHQYLDDFYDYYKITKILLLEKNSPPWGGRGDLGTEIRSEELNALLLEGLDRIQRRIELVLAPLPVSNLIEFIFDRKQRTGFVEKVVSAFIFARVANAKSSDQLVNYVIDFSNNLNLSEIFQNTPLAPSNQSTSFRSLINLPAGSYNLDFIFFIRYLIYFNSSFESEQAPNQEYQRRAEFWIDRYCDFFSRISSDSDTLHFQDNFKQIEEEFKSVDFKELFPEVNQFAQLVKYKGVSLPEPLHSHVAIFPEKTRKFRGCVRLGGENNFNMTDPKPRADEEFLSTSDKKATKKIVIKNSNVYLPLDSMIVAPGFNFEIHSSDFDGLIISLGTFRRISPPSFIPSREPKDTVALPILIGMQYLPSMKNGTRVIDQNDRKPYPSKIHRVNATHRELEEYFDLARGTYPLDYPGIVWIPFHFVIQGAGRATTNPSEFRSKAFGYNGGNLRVFTSNPNANIVYFSSGGKGPIIQSPKGGKGLNYRLSKELSTKWVSGQLSNLDSRDGFDRSDYDSEVDMLSAIFRDRVFYLRTNANKSQSIWKRIKSNEPNVQITSSGPSSLNASPLLFTTKEESELREMFEALSEDLIDKGNSNGDLTSIREEIARYQLRIKNLEKLAFNVTLGSAEEGPQKLITELTKAVDLLNKIEAKNTNLISDKQILDDRINLSEKLNQNISKISNFLRDLLELQAARTEKQRQISETIEILNNLKSNPKPFTPDIVQKINKNTLELSQYESELGELDTKVTEIELSIREIEIENKSLLNSVDPKDQNQTTEPRDDSEPEGSPSYIQGVRDTVTKLRIWLRKLEEEVSLQNETLNKELNDINLNFENVDSHLETVSEKIVQFFNDHRNQIFDKTKPRVIPSVFLSDFNRNDFEELLNSAERVSSNDQSRGDLILYIAPTYTYHYMRYQNRRNNEYDAAELRQRVRAYLAQNNSPYSFDDLFGSDEASLVNFREWLFALLEKDFKVDFSIGLDDPADGGFGKTLTLWELIRERTSSTFSSEDGQPFSTTEVIYGKEGAPGDFTKEIKEGR